MRLAHAAVRNFRSLKNVEVDFAAYTAFIGGNGAGKSSILKAIDVFFGTRKVLDSDDYFGRDTNVPVEIELTFDALSAEQIDLFSNRVRDGRLVVTRIFDTSGGSGRYHGVVPQNPAFREIRSGQNFNAKRAVYNQLRAQDPAYAELPVINSQTLLDEALLAWERDHEGALELMRDDGQFFGFQNAGRGALQRHINFVFVPAVREAAVDATDAKSSAIQQLLEIVVRSAILRRPELQSFRAEVNARYQELTSPENMPELAALGSRLTTDIQRLYADASVGLAWRPAGEMPIPLPAADVTLSQDGFGGPVDRQGHGLQRALVFTLLQHLARASTSVEDTPADGEVVHAEVPPVPSLIIGIEEPELYQHPTKQRHLASVLRQLSEGSLPGADGPTQIAFASHSPMFVSMPHVDEIRFVRRVGVEDGEPKECQLHALDLDSVVLSLARAARRPPGSFSADGLKARLHILGPELAEGFFADGVVLVEGRSDKAALVAAADRLGVSFESAGVALLSAEGKSCIDRPLLIFRALGIPVYPIWDCDTDKPASEAKPQQNLLLMRAADPDTDHDVAPTSTLVEPAFACFAHNLEATLQEELTPEVYRRCLDEAAEEHGAGGNDVQKNPEIMKRILARANDLGHSSRTLEAIVRSAWVSLKGRPIAAAPLAD
jgi:hypothetical protein